MQGYDTLWVPGTDHASIATEAKIVEKMRQEGLTKEDVGRDGFLERAWEWKNQYGGRIIEQLKKWAPRATGKESALPLTRGAARRLKRFSCAFTKRDLFTGVKELLTGAPIAKPLFRTPRLNMRSRQGIFGICATRLRTAAAIWSLHHPPETLLGDTAVAVNPNDERYKDLVGKILILPLVTAKYPLLPMIMLRWSSERCC